MAVKFVFEDATLLVCTGRVPQPHTRVLVGAGHLERVQPNGRSPRPADAIVIDCQGRTLMPGLLDAHVHLAINDLDPLAEAALPPAVLALRIAREIERTLEAGFTTVRDAGGLDWGFKEAVRLGLLRGPRIFISGAFISQTGGHGDHRARSSRLPFPTVAGLTSESILADGPEEVRRAAREVLRRGADQVKVMASGGAASPSDELDHVQFTVEELAAAVDAAHAVGSYVLAHAYGPRAIQNCIEAGVRSIEHANFLDEETADRMLAADDAYLVPTIITYELLSAREAEGGWTPDMVRKIRQGLTGAYDALGLAFEKGLRIGSGSDVLAEMQGQKGKEIACQARVMGAMNAIIAATRTNARLMRIDDQVGTLEAGKRADLILLDRDPLADTAIFGDPDRVRLVMTQGEIVKNLDAGSA
ncbi:MAG TPA: amidohydrolase family protein [Candidatus Dormibacteraeota bacterium]|nr:amidohydrolase family protein [Candidatus Dormibacteraeota bacterium]